MATLISQLENLFCFPKIYGFLIFWMHILKSFSVLFNYLYWPYFYPRTLVFLKWETQIQAGSVNYLLPVENILFFWEKANIFNEFFGQQGQTISDDTLPFLHKYRTDERLCYANSTTDKNDPNFRTKENWRTWWCFNKNAKTK